MSMIVWPTDIPESLERLGDRIRTWRERKGWTQVQAAAVLDVSVRTWKSWERGKGVRRQTLLALLAVDLMDLEPEEEE